ncbi:monocarboxylate transporter 12-like isoform X2 [Dermacentor silvarum]|uniref:monocarboxylate transporter 12-like isoform X2 n=1 Tax=Dermacentor silvarum TaxID=543639 RepID=UPI001898B69D|nr:monocarboxylate transporter 12-like isoform X2 [Dermacentor silvarum]
MARKSETTAQLECPCLEEGRSLTRKDALANGIQQLMSPSCNNNERKRKSEGTRTPHMEQRTSQRMEDGNTRRPTSNEVFTISKLEPESHERTPSPPRCLAASGRLSLGGCHPTAPKLSDVRIGNKAEAAGIDKCWWVAVLAFAMTTMESSSSRCSGFLMVGIMEQMNVERGLASWPVSLIGSLIDCGGLLSGPLSELFTTVPVLVGGSALAAAGIIVSSFSPDITWLSVTLGVMHGLGLGIVITMLQVLISMYFERYRGTANGIMFAGSTASAFIFPHLLLYFKDTYGFRGSLLMFGAVLMNMVALSLAFREPHWFRRDRVKRGKSLQRTPRPSIFPTDPMKETKVSATAEVLRNICGVLKCPMMYVLVVTWLAFCYNYDIFFSTIVDFAMDKGLTLEDTVSFITYTSITDLVGRVVLPILTDRGFLQRSTLMTLNYFLLGLCGVLLPFCESYWALLVACLGLALFLGCAITMQSVLMAQYLGIEKLAVGYSVLGALCGPALLGKAPFVGFFRDDLGSYNEMFWVLGGLSFFVTFQWALVSLTDRQRVRKWQPDIAHPCSGQKT